MRKCIVLVVVSFLFSSFFSINLKGKNEEEIKKMILGKWIDKSRSKDGYLTSYYKNFYLNDSVECMLITKNLRSKIPADTVYYKLHYQIKKDSLIYNLGGIDKPYYEGHKIVYLSKNRMRLQFKKSISKYKRIN